MDKVIRLFSGPTVAPVSSRGLLIASLADLSPSSSLLQKFIVRFGFLHCPTVAPMTTPRFHSVDRYNAICRGFFTDGLAHELALLAKSVTRCLRRFQGLASHFIGSDHSDANSTFSGGEANLSLINEHEFMHLTIQYHACGKLHRWTRLSGYFLVREILQCLPVWTAHYFTCRPVSEFFASSEGYCSGSNSCVVPQSAP